MPEREDERQPLTEENFGESERETPSVVQVGETSALELLPTPVERVLESYIYAPEQTLELISATGRLEKYRVVSFNPDNQEVFITRLGDKATPPSLEIFNQKELAAEEASLPLALAANEVWDDVVESSAQVKDFVVKPEVFRDWIPAQKGRLIRAAALEAFNQSPDLAKSKNPDALKLVLSRVLSRYIEEQTAGRNSRDPRHGAVEAANLTAGYLDAVTDLRLTPDQVSTAELVKAKIELYKRNLIPNHEVSLQSLSTIPSSYEQAQAKAREAWLDLRSKIQSAERLMHLTDPSSAKARDISESLEQAFKQALEADKAANIVRVRNEGDEEAYAELRAMLMVHENVPAVAVADRMKKRRKAGVIEPLAIPERPPVSDTKPELTPSGTRLGQFIDNIVKKIEDLIWDKK